MMHYLKIHRCAGLSGRIYISGAKNASLPILASSLLFKNLEITNLPDVADVKTLAKLLDHLGCLVEWVDSHSLKICAERIVHMRAIYDIVRKMRASILVLGPLLSRFGECEVSLPGGCAIGARPVDLHIKAMEKMGAEIGIENGYIVAKAPKGLKGTQVTFDKITVTGTENLIMAAALADGQTTIINAAKEPEVVSLCNLLGDSGVEIDGIGTDILKIRGTQRELLDFNKVEIIADRIEAGTYLCVGAITNSELELRNADPQHMQAVINKLQEIGFSISSTQDSIKIFPASKRNAFELITTEYPGFPTDMQAQFMALATQCDGMSIIEERLFENRFMHVSELQRLGANITLRGSVAQVRGGENLLGADVMATDLRASSALVLSALVAQGFTQVHRIYHLDRGYEKIEEKLRSVGVCIQRLKE